MTNIWVSSSFYNFYFHVFHVGIAFLKHVFKKSTKCRILSLKAFGNIWMKMFILLISGNICTLQRHSFATILPKSFLNLDLGAYQRKGTLNAWPIL